MGVVSFPAASERLAALLGGHVDFLLLEPPEAGELIRAGKLRAVVQIAEKRLPGYERRADPAGGRLQDTERAAGARHRRSARHAGGRGRLLPGHAGEDVALAGWQKFLTGNQLDDAYLDAKATTAFLGEYEDQLRKILIQSGQKLVRYPCGQGARRAPPEVGPGENSARKSVPLRRDTRRLGQLLHHPARAGEQ